MSPHDPNADDRHAHGRDADDRNPDDRHREPDPGLAALRDEIDSVERAVVRRIDPGAKAMVIACSVLLMLVAAMLPWIGDNSGWHVLLGRADPADGVGLLPRLFTVTSVGFGVLGSVAALLSRRWVLAWVCAVGCAFSVVNGVWAIWSRQTTDGAGPAVGLLLGVLTMLVLAVSWLRLAWSRPT